MQSQHIQMTLAEFDCMIKKPGWKHEYYEGRAHISPGYQLVNATIKTTPRSFNLPCELRAVKSSDKSRLISTYFAAFSDTIEYCDWTPDKIKESAISAIVDFLAEKCGKPHPASCVAVSSQIVVGAALLIENNEELSLDMLFVVPEWQRKGLSTAMVSSAISELNKIGISTLKSRFFLGNSISRAWHRNYGFMEEPEFMRSDDKVFEEQ